MNCPDAPSRGDEFVVLTAGCTAHEAESLGRRLIEVVGTPYDLGLGAPACIGVSVGIAMVPEHGREASDLLRAADAALYEAKSVGGSRCPLASSVAPVARRRHAQAEVSASAAA
jgi:diguanylate cyclase (GGDEF)-like protein